MNYDKEHQKFYEDSTLFLKTTMNGKCDQSICVLIELLVKTYMCNCGIQDSTLLLELVQNCFDHYQELANLHRIN